MKVWLFTQDQLDAAIRALQFYASRITVRNAARILRLYAELMS